MVKKRHQSQFKKIGYTPVLIVCLLCIYFSYHLLQGERSLWSYVDNQTKISEAQAELSQIEAETAALSDKINRLQLTSLDADFLEERARYLLGYVSPNELIVIEE